MRVAFFSTVFVSLLVAACGSKDSDSAAGSTAALASLPATLEGELIAGSSEGDYDETPSEYVFGALTVGDETLSVLVPPSILKAAALPDDVGMVRATLSSKNAEFGVDAYVITELRKL
jgi:hypothetical protein